MNTQDYKRKLTAVFSADVAGYSRLMGENEAETVKTLTGYRKIMEEVVHQHRGRIIDSPGDNILAEFASVVDAVQCAVAAQNEFKAWNANLPENRRMEFRIGVNLGDVIEEESRIYGDGVNIAARLEGLAEAGGICISGTAFDQVKNKVAVGFQYLGKQTVKNIADPVRAYKVLMKPEAVGKVIGEEVRRLKRWPLAAVAAALVVVLGGLAIWNFYYRPPPMEPASREKMALPLPDLPSVAVLPFTNMSEDPKQEFLCDGITENIITALSKVPRLFVIARNSTFAYKGQPVKVKQVSEELGVQYVLEGSVQRSAERIRINAQLIDALKGHHIWAERYDRDLTDLFELQDEITLKILNAIQVKLTEGETYRPTAYAGGKEDLDCYLKAMEATSYVQRANIEDTNTARQIAEQAITTCPESLKPYGLMAAIHMMDYWFGTSKSPKESIGKAIELVQKSLAVDDTRAENHALLGQLYCLIKRWDKAISEGERGVALNPSGADVNYWYAATLTWAGRPEEAIILFEKAIRLNPFGPSRYFLNYGHALRYVGRFDEAVSAYKKALQREPNNLFAHLGLSSTFSIMGHEKEAQAEVAKVLRLNPKFNLDHLAKVSGFKDRAETNKIIDALRKAGLPETPPLPLPDKPSIAVLPFVNMSDDKSQAYFSDGLTEEIITALSKTPKLFVIARNSTFVYKGKPVNVQQVSRELGVKYVLEGSVRRSGDQLRITAQLIDGTTGNHLWAERYDREMKDVFAIQDEVTMKILTSLQVTLTEGESARSFERGTDSLEAYLKTIEGRELMFALNKDDNALARRKFDEAIALDPNFARAYAALSLAYTLDFMYRVDPMESLKRAYEFAQKAIALDEGQLLAHGALEFVYGWKRQHEMAIAAGERAVQIAPGCADAYFYLGRALNFACRDEEAVSQLEKAIRMNPFPPGPYYMHLGMSYLSLRQYEKAVTVLKKCITLSPKNISARRMLTVTYVEMGRLEEARVEAEEILKIDPKFTSKGFEKIVPFKDAEITKRYIEGLRAAGLERDI